MEAPELTDADRIEAARATPVMRGATGAGPCAKGAGRPRSDDIETRMENLIASATSLFVDKGYSNVSLEMIAREAHVAVRTIYVKFGGKAGLFNAVVAAGRARFFPKTGNMDTDARPIEQVLGEFGGRFLDLLSTPMAISMQRMVIAEAKTNPELARTFFDAGPAHTRDTLTRYFARPEIGAQLRDDVAADLLPTHFINCVLGDQFTRFLFEPECPSDAAKVGRDLAQRLALFYRAVLRHPV